MEEPEGEEGQQKTDAYEFNPQYYSHHLFTGIRLGDIYGYKV